MVSLNRNGRYWQARWIDPLTGRLCRRSIGPRETMNRSQALAVCAVIGDEVSQSATIRLEYGDKPITLAEFREKWFAMRGGDLLKSSVRVHQRYWNTLIDQVGADTALPSVTKQIALDARTRLCLAADARCGVGTIARAKAESTIARFVRNARQYWRDASKLDYVKDNPWLSCKSSAPEIQLPRRVLNDNEIELLLAKAKPGLRCLIALCYYAGLRKSEATRLEWCNVQFHKQRLVVYPPQGRVSTKHRYREVLLCKRLDVILTEVLRVNHLVCGGVTSDRAWLDLHSLAAEVGLQGDLSFQLMRSSCENNWMGSYPPNVVTAWMGHSAQVAAKHYRGVPDSFYSGDPRDVEIAKLRAELENERAKRLAEMLERN